MLKQNLELVKRGWEQFKTTGEVLADVMAADVIWDMSTFRDAVAGLDAQYEGAEGTRRFIRERIEPFDDRIDLALEREIWLYQRTYYKRLAYV